MAKCLICDKSSQMAGIRSRLRAGKYNPSGTKRQRPNLQWAKLANGQRVKACTKCIKKIHLKSKI